jgi:excisionase family DNA binding protein
VQTRIERKEGNMKNQNENIKNFLTINEASIYLNLRVSKLRSLVFKKQIPIVKIGRLIRFEKSQIDSWLRKCRVSVK